MREFAKLRTRKNSYFFFGKHNPKSILKISNKKSVFIKIINIHI